MLAASVMTNRTQVRTRGAGGGTAAAETGGFDSVRGSVIGFARGILGAGLPVLGSTAGPPPIQTNATTVAAGGRFKVGDAIDPRNRDSFPEGEIPRCEDGQTIPGLRFAPVDSVRHFV
jgi:hypothetical protein